MLTSFLIATALIFALLMAWVGVQFLYRSFSKAHPEMGPPREEGLGCGLFCGCLNKGSCPKSRLSQSAPHGDSQSLNP